MTRSLFVVAAAMLAVGEGSQAKPTHADLNWMAGPPGLPDGAQMAVVSGDPGKAEMFKINLKMPAGYAVPAHWHPTDEKLSVLSGKLGYGMSSKLDHAKAKWATPGHRVMMKAKMNHWVFAKTASEVQISSMGPFQITYVDLKDDPRTK